MHYEKFKGKWEGADTWHHLYLTQEEGARVFLSPYEVFSCKKRNGGEWKNSNAGAFEILRPEVDQWMRENAGHRQSEIWECDRYYYPHETPPELPRGGRSQWLKHFVCYPDRDGAYNTHGWQAGSYIEYTNSWRRPGIKCYIGFREEFVPNAELLPTLFAIMFLS